MKELRIYWRRGRMKLGNLSKTSQMIIVNRYDNCLDDVREKVDPRACLKIKSCTKHMFPAAFSFHDKEKRAVMFR